MKIKRFVASDMRRAISTVKDVMGLNAVILSTDRVGNNIEILAATDYDEKLHSQMSDQKPLDVKAVEIQDIPVPGMVPTAESGASDTALASLQQEISNLRVLLEGKLSPGAWSKTVELQSDRTKIGKRLESLGLSRGICRSIEKKLSHSPETVPTWQELLKTLGRQLRVTGDDLLNDGGIIAIVGATGVGKTTTVAKLAARFALRHGRNQVGLITTDSLRIGGQEQLMTFGRILGVPVKVATSPDELTERIRELSDRRLVLIDTAGMSQRDVKLAKHLAALEAGATGIQTYLAMSATSQPGIAEEVIDAFDRTRLSAAIITKTDEATSIGPVLSGAIRYNLPLAYICNGQGVPEDIHPATIKALLETTLSLMKYSKQIRVKHAHQLQKLKAV